MKVIGAGFGRTGTLSLKTALDELGFGPCYHMQEVIRQPRHVKQWQAAADGQTVDWDSLLHKYEATVDWPGCTFYEALLHQYPDAKVILSVRDPERWYESTEQTIYRAQQPLPPWVRWLLPPLYHFTIMVDTLIWKGTFHERFQDRTYALKVFTDHIEAVKARVPPVQLLVFDVKEGWAPLCEFLGVPVPAERPFPHANDRKRVQQMMNAIKLLVWTLPVVFLVAVMALVGLILYLIKRAQFVEN